MTGESKQLLLYGLAGVVVLGFSLKYVGMGFALRAANNAEAEATNELRRKSQEMDFGNTLLRIFDPLGLFG